MGVFWAGIRRSRVPSSAAKTPLLLADMCVVRENDASGLVRLRRAVKDGSLPGMGSGLGCLPYDAVWLRSAASTAIASFGVRRVPEVAQPLGRNLRFDVKGGVVGLEVKRREMASSRRVRWCTQV